MASNSLAELRNMPEAELQQRVETWRHEVLALRLKAHQGSCEQPHRIRQLRRDIARAFTIAREKSRAAAATRTTT